MKLLILYATKSGTTKTCADLLAREFPRGSVEVLPVARAESFDDYDFVILGASVRLGKLHKDMRSFLQKNAEKLPAGRTGCYYCCGLAGDADRYDEKLYPESVLKKSFAVMTFGGELRSEKQKGLFDRLFVRYFRSLALGGGDNGEAREDIALPSIAESNIHVFAEKIKTLCGEKSGLDE